ncbi:LysR family transcriptional regulator [Oricola thermophila]|uniref:LysR family transcriptional regulator n=1 Tax=Oricola thermophila TaxID=2742145 RepID=A0A6N1VJ17_9HYPH|nr:LysR family transcriptional regulator [Oricola thermophila]QKV19735.1 LysR family transcriptional regulator [Oricola thermophila]
MNEPKTLEPAANSLLLDADLLKTFVAIVETGSFSRAAQRVFRTPSAVSMQVKKMEDMLGTSVFERDSRSVSLTADGEVLLTYAKRILALNREMMARFVTPDMAGTVRFGAPDDYGIRLIPHILRKFAATHPNVTVDVVLDGSSRLVERYRAGTLDIALLNVAPDRPLEADAEVLLEEPLVWAGVRNGTAHLRSPVPLAMWEQGCIWRANAVEALESRGIAYRVGYMSGNYAVQIAAVEADLAIAPIPALLIEEPLVALGKANGLPELKSTQIRMMARHVDDCAVAAVADHVRNCIADWKAGRLDCRIAA